MEKIEKNLTGVLVGSRQGIESPLDIRSNFVWHPSLTCCRVCQPGMYAYVHLHRRYGEESGR